MFIYFKMVIITEVPQFQEFTLEGVRFISPEDTLNAVSNREAYLLDVREPNETSVEAVKLPWVIYLPLSLIESRLAEIPKDNLVITACPGGIRSVRVANLLYNTGFTNIASLDGGLNLWKARVLPYEYNLGKGSIYGTKPAKPDFKSFLEGSKLDFSRIGTKK